jgi:hypothetical protein
MKEICWMKLLVSYPAAIFAATVTVESKENAVLRLLRYDAKTYPEHCRATSSTTLNEWKVINAYNCAEYFIT